MRGTARLSMLEGALDVQIDLAATGTGMVTGELRKVGGGEATLKFSFETDQTFIGQAMDDLERVLGRYPTRTPR